MAYNKETQMNEGYIYLIINNVNGKKYVGQTARSIEFRFKQHKNRSKKGNYNQPLYNAFKKYGVENFNVTEICTLTSETKEGLSNLLNQSEIEYIKRYNSKVPNGYNVLDGGDVNPTYLTCRKVYQFDIEGNLICVFQSISECIRHLGLKGETSLKQHIQNKSIYKGYFWSHDSIINISDYQVTKKIEDIHPVYQYDLKGNLTNVFSCIQNVDNNIISSKTVSKACKIYPHYAKGFIWTYDNKITRKHIDDVSIYLERLKEEKTQKIRKPIDYSKINYHKIPIYQFTLDGEFIKQWDSISDASLFITNGKSRSALASALRKESSQAYGFLWSYDNISPGKYSTRIEKFGKKVNQYDMSFNYITTFSSAIEASISVGSKCYQSISGVCRGATHHSFGYMWRYVGENDDNPNLYYEKMGYMKSVDKFDLQGNYICSYDDMISISDEFQPSLILRCCEGKIQKAYNHIWKYSNITIKSVNE